MRTSLIAGTVLIGALFVAGCAPKPHEPCAPGWHQIWVPNSSGNDYLYGCFQESEDGNIYIR